MRDLENHMLLYDPIYEEEELVECETCGSEISDEEICPECDAERVTKEERIISFQEDNARNLD